MTPKDSLEISMANKLGEPLHLTECYTILVPGVVHLLGKLFDRRLLFRALTLVEEGACKHLAKFFHQRVSRAYRLVAIAIPFMQS